MADGNKLRGAPLYNAPGRGRKKGTPSRFTQLKRSFLEAFYSEELGGVDGLIKWAKLNNDNRTNFYKFIVQLIPKDLKLSGDADRPLASKVVIEVKDSSLPDEVDPDDDEQIIDLGLSDEECKEAAYKLLEHRE
jgi:hypothetical protein